jgi:hypothetical protein
MANSLPIQKNNKFSRPIFDFDELINVDGKNYHGYKIQDAGILS